MESDDEALEKPAEGESVVVEDVKASRNISEFVVVVYSPGKRWMGIEEADFESLAPTTQEKQKKVREVL